MFPHGCPAGVIILLRSPPSGVTAMNDAVDPVCKMTVDVDKAMWRSTYRGKEYFFCAKGCKDAFDRDPEKFL